MRNLVFATELISFGYLRKNLGKAVALPKRVQLDFRPEGPGRYELNYNKVQWGQEIEFKQTETPVRWFSNPYESAFVEQGSGTWNDI